MSGGKVELILASKKTSRHANINILAQQSTAGQ